MRRQFFQRINPPKKWRWPVLGLVAIFSGLILFTLYLSKAPSYFSDKPETCVNCHIMAPQYATWSHSSHREWAHCNDCHVPHNNVLNKYYFKAKDGLRHATVFTLRKEPQVIHIKEEGREVVQNNCIRCHDHLLDHFRYLAGTGPHLEEMTGRLCRDCHREVPHGRVNSLSSTPNARVPLPQSPVPDWLKKLTETQKD
ncbi:MAG TPA: cytochrome c nitrite reductase small subunit [Bacteroidetes bacterium]|mgnify:CR=1 FL=1|nr:cytochrome c nitrite reductase small subunit [Bacteroidota bacterium]